MARNHDGGGDRRAFVVDCDADPPAIDESLRSSIASGFAASASRYRSHTPEDRRCKASSTAASAAIASRIRAAADLSGLPVAGHEDDVEPVCIGEDSPACSAQYRLPGLLDRSRAVPGPLESPDRARMERGRFAGVGMILALLLARSDLRRGRRGVSGVGACVAIRRSLVLNGVGQGLASEALEVLEVSQVDAPLKLARALTD